MILEATRDYYEILGVGKTADEATIKKAYRRLAKKYHPDTNAGNSESEQRFKEITEAYTVLSDPEKRKSYDQFGQAAFDGSMHEDGAFRSYHFEGDQMDDIFGDFFENLFRQGGSRQDRHRQAGRQQQRYRQGSFQQDLFRQKGADLHSEISVTFEEAAFGCDKILHLSSPNAADGRTEQTLQVHIPAGIDSGKSVRLHGKGQPGTGGGEAGDLLLKVRVGTKPGFERAGTDVYTTVNIPYTTAVFGGEATVHTLYGDVLCKIRPATQSGTKIRLKGKGIVSMKDSNIYGDQYVSVQIEVPKTLSPEARQKLKEFEEIVTVQSPHGYEKSQ